MQKYDRCSPVSVTLDVDCAGTDGQAKQIGVDADLGGKRRFVAALCAGS